MNESTDVSFYHSINDLIVKPWNSTLSINESFSRDNE